MMVGDGPPQVTECCGEGRQTRLIAARPAAGNMAVLRCQSIPLQHRICASLHHPCRPRGYRSVEHGPGRDIPDARCVGAPSAPGRPAGHPRATNGTYNCSSLPAAAASLGGERQLTLHRISADSVTVAQPALQVSLQAVATLMLCILHMCGGTVSQTSFSCAS